MSEQVLKVNVCLCRIEHSKNERSSGSPENSRGRVTKGIQWLLSGWKALIVDS